MQDIFPICSREVDAPSSPADVALCSTGEVLSWHIGVEPSPVAVNPARDPVITGLVLLLVAMVMFNFRYCRRLARNLSHDLFGARQRENVFDETSANETRTFAILILQLCVLEAILFLVHFRPWTNGMTYTDINIASASLLGLTLGYYIVMFGVYALVGWVFADSGGMRLWLRGYNASSGLLAVLLLLPAMVALFYPTLSSTMALIGLICFLVAKLCFILKGFRIFYHNILSLLYFILYLCSVEIIPFLIVYAGAAFLCDSNY